MDGCGGLEQEDQTGRGRGEIREETTKIKSHLKDCMET